MILRSCRAVVVIIALLLVACTAHQHQVDACPESELLNTVQGRWQVGYAIYRDGQKPPGQRAIGELRIDGCDFEFVASEDARFGEHRAERLAAAADLPFIDAPHGRVEVLEQSANNPDEHRYVLGQLRLTTAAKPGEVGRVWDASVNRIGAGYLYLWPDRPKSFHGSVERGTRVWLPHEYRPSSDPNELAPPELLERMNATPDPE